VNKQSHKVISVQNKKKIKNHYSITTENGISYTISKSIAIKYNLKENTVIQKSDFQKILNEDQLLKIKNKIVHLLSYKTRSKHELLKKLLSNGFEKSNILIVIKEMSERGYINDKEFAKTYAEYLIIQKNMGNYAVKNKLLGHKISPSVFEPILSELYALYPEEYIINKILEKKKWKNPVSKKERKKILNYLNRRGFSWDEINGALIGFQ